MHGRGHGRMLDIAGVNGIVIYESLTGNTKRGGGPHRRGADARGVRTSTSPITNIDYQALHESTW